MYGGMLLDLQVEIRNWVEIAADGLLVAVKKQFRAGALR